MNPPAAGPHLGVDLSPLLKLRRANTLRAPDLVRAAQIAEDAGADAVLLSLDAPPSNGFAAEIAALIDAVHGNVQLRLPASPAMIDVANSLRPGSVCFRILTRHEDNDGVPSLEALKECMGGLIAGMTSSVSIVANPERIRQLSDAGVWAVELRTERYSLAALSERPVDLAQLDACARVAGINGMKVQVAGGLDYHNVSEIAGLADIDQINIGHAIATRALFSGWQNAVAEMGGLLRGAAKPVRR